jgi:hypothetical protein
MCAMRISSAITRVRGCCERACPAGGSAQEGQVPSGAHSDDIAKYVAERQRHASRQSLGHRDAHRDASHF